MLLCQGPSALGFVFLLRTIIEASALSHSTPHPLAVGDYHGHDTALVYSTIEYEYNAAVSRCAVIDRSWIGKIELRGDDALDLLHRISTNDLLRTKAGSARSTVLLTDKGRIIDYICIVPWESGLLLLVSPGGEGRIREWIEKYTIMEAVHPAVQTDNIAILSFIGPMARQCVEGIFECTLEPDSISEPTLPSTRVKLLYRSEFHADIVDVLVPEEGTSEVWDRVATRRDEMGIVNMGTRAYEAFRISHGIPATGTELSDKFNPYEVGLRSAISFTKGCYIGQEVIARLDTYEKIQREPWGVVIDGETANVRPDAPILTQDTQVGLLTSISDAVIHGKRFGIGIMKKGHIRSDDPITVLADGEAVHGKCVSFPIRLGSPVGK